MTKRGKNKNSARARRQPRTPDPPSRNAVTRLLLRAGAKSSRGITPMLIHQWELLFLQRLVRSGALHAYADRRRVLEPSDINWALHKNYGVKLVIPSGSL